MSLFMLDAPSLETNFGICNAKTVTIIILYYQLSRKPRRNHILNRYKNILCFEANANKSDAMMIMKTTFILEPEYSN